jgi:UDP-3-O-[3-hydroxymyristoyl] glucosamine N-acyltransferase
LKMALTVEQLAQRLGGSLVGAGSASISSVSPVAAAKADTVTFVTDDRYAKGLRDSAAAAVMIGAPIEGLPMPQIVVQNVHAALIEAMRIFAPRLKPPVEGVDERAKVASTARIGKGACIAANAVIEDNARIGDNTLIGYGCVIGENTRVGDNCRLDSNVVVYHNCTIGNNVIIQANSTIGATGFGYYFIDGAHRLIPHNGTVLIEDFVEIGANTCIDRAKFGETRISAGTKIDNLVQIAHNVVIGKCCLIAGQVGIAGSVRLGDGVIMGGQAGATDNLEIGDGAMVGAVSIATHNIPAGSKVAGYPAYDLKEWIKVTALTRRLPKVFEQLKQLSARIEELEASEDDKK